MLTLDCLQGTRVGYAGEVNEAEADLNVLGVRVYAPGLRRFLSADALSPMSEGGINRYAYCAGDPVNRVDPQGESFFDWLLSGAGLVGALVGLAGAIAAIPTGGASLAATVGLWGAVALETVSVAAEVGSVVTNAIGESELGGVFGWVALGAGLAAGGAGAASRMIGKGARASAASPNAARSFDERGVRWKRFDPWRKVDNRTIANRSELPASRLYVDKEGGVGVIPRRYKIETGAPGGERILHVGYDSKVSLSSTLKDLTEIAATANAETPVYFYTGVHGRADGQNWRTGIRSGRASWAYRNTIAASPWKGGARTGGAPREVIDMGRITACEATKAWSRPGVHIHGYCFSAVDELLLQVTNRAPVPVYL